MIVIESGQMQLFEPSHVPGGAHVHAMPVELDASEELASVGEPSEEEGVVV
jgi:hypothetical protein